MQKLAVVPLLLASVALAGCGTSNPSGQAQASASASASASAPGTMPVTAATAVTGTVTVPNPPSPITPQATLELSLVDVTQQPGVVVNKQDYAPPQFPQAFRIPFSADAINAKDLYVVQAKMVDGDRTYSLQMPPPVLTRGQAAKVDLALTVEPTAGEKMLLDFENAKRQMGGMSVKNGTAAKIGESRSWQVFSDAQGVKFIIEQVDQTGNGFTKTEYAFRNDLPWVVVETHMPKQDAPATSISRAGWDDNGTLVLKDQVNGSKTTTLSPAAARALRQQAESELKRLGGKTH